MNVSAIDELTPSLWDSGRKLLQTYRFAHNDVEHVRRLLIWLDPAFGAKIIDMGCGVGEVARIMRSMRQDLQFTLVNISPVQLGYCSPCDDLCLSDFITVPRNSAKYDCAIFMFSIGHENIGVSMKEAYRLLKSGGVLFVFDMERLSGDNDAMSALVSYNVLSETDFRNAALGSGFIEDFCLKPKAHFNIGQEVCGSNENYEEIFGGVSPIVWRFIKP